MGTIEGFKVELGHATAESILEPNLLAAYQWNRVGKLEAGEWETN